jgi:hypothetical protein
MGLENRRQIYFNNKSFTIILCLFSIKNFALFFEVIVRLFIFHHENLYKFLYLGEYLHIETTIFGVLAAVNTSNAILSGCDAVSISILRMEETCSSATLVITNKTA